MKTPSRYTKLKVVAGYILLFVLTIAAIVFIYKQISRFNNNDQLVSTANQKLFIIGNTITGLYEAESLSNSFLQTGSAGSFRKYISIIRQVELNIDSLKNMIIDSTQQARIDTINQLLNSKIKNLKELIRVKKAQEPDEYYNRAMALIQSAKDSFPDLPNIQKRIITTRDSSYIKTKKKKKGFLGLFSSREPDSALQVSVSSHVIWDTVSAALSSNNADSIVNILRSTWDNFQTETENLNRQISRQEYNIVAQSVRITEQLKKVLYEFETEEINHSLNRMQQREEVMNSAAGLIAKIAIIAVLFIAFFCTLILKDISRSQRYRKELEAANRYADQLLKSRESLLLTVTHDIKSPLSSIMGYIELLNSTPTDERQRYFLKNMKCSSEHIQKLVMNLLDFAKLENNKIQPEEVIFNPHQLFREICDSFIPTAREKQLALHGHIDEKLEGEYYGDVLRIRQITVNLMSNALKYTAQGSIGLKVGTNIPGDKLIFSIRDTGPGLTPEEQHLIFKEFTRLSSGSQHEGTGLGLTITQKLVHLLGGKLSLESQPGKGSCFTVELPLKKAPTHPEPDIEEIHSPSLPPVKLLLIDDDKLQLEMTAALLKNKGITADILDNPSEIGEQIEKGNYNAIFTDIQMPGTDGFTILRHIRNASSETIRNLPVVALSARSDLAEDFYRKSGFTAYLNKPFTPEQLFQVITRIMGKETKESPVLSPSEKTITSDPDKNYSLKQIEVFADQDEESVHKIIASFITETERNLEEWKKLLANGQTGTLQKLAHKMLPMFRQLEATILVELLVPIERSTPENGINEDFKAKAERIVPETQALLQQLRQETTTNETTYSKE